MEEKTIELLEERRSVRSFKDEKIDPVILERLKELTLRAPSGGNMQTWSVIEVTDQEKKERLSVLCDNQPMIAKAPIVWVFLADFERWYHWMKEGGSGERAGKEVKKPGIGNFHLAMQDAVIAAEYAAVAAEALGLGSCYIGDIIENYEELKVLLDLPKYAAPACMLIMGIPKGNDTSLKTLRPDSKYIFMENKYKHYSPEECEDIYKEHRKRLEDKKILPNSISKTYADYYFNRKYSSAFMDEMNRSAEVFLKEWCED